MFERFTDAARAAVNSAPGYAERYADQEIAPLHLFAGLLNRPDHVPPPLDRFLAPYHVTSAELYAELDRMHHRGGLSDADEAALRTIGIDVTAVFDSIERTLGPDALTVPPQPGRRRPRYPFSAAAKKILEYAVREAASTGHRGITEEHMLLALLRQPGPVADVLAEHGLRYAEFRARRSAA